VIVGNAPNNTGGVPPYAKSSVSIVNGWENTNVPLLLTRDIEGNATDYVTIFAVAVGNVSVIFAIRGDDTLGSIEIWDIRCVSSGDRNNKRVARLSNNYRDVSKPTKVTYLSSSRSQWGAAPNWRCW
jgi:hypothetical protein